MNIFAASCTTTRPGCGRFPAHGVTTRRRRLSTRMDARIYTIGHSRHPLATFLELLRGHGIAVLADVRSLPRSRFLPHFNREPLRQALAAAGVGYVFLGRELGARSDDPACWRDGRASYDLIALDARFQEGLERLRVEAAARRVCLMCAERDPLACHRTLLVGVRLRSPRLELAHILADGGLEPHERTEARLLARHGLDQPELFRSAEERLAEAYHLQRQRTEYRRKP
jgi:uncharacterized protein (DUF488 family)